MQWLQWPTGGKDFSVFRLEVTDRSTSLASSRILTFSPWVIRPLPRWHLHDNSALTDWLPHILPGTFETPLCSTLSPLLSTNIHCTAIQYILHSHTVHITQPYSTPVMSETSFFLIVIEIETFENLVLISRLVSRLLELQSWYWDWYRDF